MFENKQLKELIYEYEKEHSTIFREWLNVISEHRNYKNAWGELKNMFINHIDAKAMNYQDNKLNPNEILNKMQELEQKHNLDKENNNEH